MKINFRKLAAIAATGMLLAQSAALAESISFSGTVTAESTREIYASIGGTVESVAVQAGQKVSAGDVLAKLSTKKVYATESGVVTGLFGQPGDSAENIAQRYGAVMYIEGESVYTIAATTDNAYNATANKFVHVGEEVYLSCYSDGSHTGAGVITGIEGTDYTVETRSGEFLVGETVSIYRGDTATSANRIGRGTLSRKSPTAVTATGSIVSFAVANGDAVERGDLLFETLDGTFDGLYMSGNLILAEEDGTVAQINMEQGSTLEQGSVAAVLYPAMPAQIAAQVAEADLGMIAVGDPVSVELLWNQDAEKTYAGVISMISAVADEAMANAESGDSGVTYTVYVDFTADADTRYGMSAIISTLDGDQAAGGGNGNEATNESEEGQDAAE